MCSEVRGVCAAATMDFLTLTFETPSFATTLALGAFSILLFFLVRFLRPHHALPSVPAVPGLPILGNMLQLKEKKPYKAYTQFAEKYGPIYSIRIGARPLIVVNSTDIAKEAMVTRFSQISTRRLSNALKILSYDKCMVAVSDYDEFHKTIKKHILVKLLGTNAQKQLRFHREIMMEKMMSQLNEHVKTSSGWPVNFRNIFSYGLFDLSLKLALGSVVESIYVEEFESTLSKEEIYKVLVSDILYGAIEVDWRDYFPYLRWVPNRRTVSTLQTMYDRRKAVMKALMNEQRKRIASGKAVNCYIDYLLAEAKELTEEQLSILLWEAIIETSDTTLVTTEWAMYEISKDKTRQGRLYEELKSVCGQENVTEEQLAKLPYLGAVFHETLRRHSPATIIPPRYVDEDTQLGGYHIPKGSEIALNIYGCNMDKNRWKDPHDWIPERFLDGRYETLDLYKTMAFGAGKRVCAGSNMAMLIACTAIGRFIKKFEWELDPNEGDNVDTAGFTTHKLHPLLVNIKPRNE